MCWRPNHRRARRRRGRYHHGPTLARRSSAGRGHFVARQKPKGNKSKKHSNLKIIVVQHRGPGTHSDLAVARTHLPRDSTAMSRGHASVSRVLVLACLFVFVTGCLCGSSASGETKPKHNDHPHRHARDEPGNTALGVTPGAPTFVVTAHGHVDTRHTGHDVVVPGEENATTERLTVPWETTTPRDEDKAGNAEKEKEDESQDATPRASEKHKDHTSNPHHVNKTTLITWGIGGDRVGRPSDAAATPAGVMEGVPEHENIMCGLARFPNPGTPCFTEDGDCSDRRW